MIDTLYYLYSFAKGIPVITMEISFLITLCSIVIIFAISNNLITVRKWVMVSILVEYLFLVVCSTVFCREENVDYQYNYIPLWSYVPMLKGDTALIRESLMNLILGFPIGVLVSVIIKIKRWWIVVLFGIVISFNIEFLQYVYKRGFSEFDDMFHNTVGCLLGYGAYCMVARYVRKARVIRRYYCF